MRFKGIGILLIVFCVAAVVAIASQPKEYETVAYRHAEDHVGEIVWIEGVVLNTSSDGNGVFLCFSNNEKYVRILIPKDYLGNFEGGIRHTYVGKRIKAIGRVDRHPVGLIVGVSEPDRIQIIENPTS